MGFCLIARCFRINQLSLRRLYSHLVEDELFDEDDLEPRVPVFDLLSFDSESHSSDGSFFCPFFSAFGTILWWIYPPNTPIYSYISSRFGSESPIGSTSLNQKNRFLCCLNACLIAN